MIVARALPDVRDEQQPQRRVLVAMNDLNLAPNRSRLKSAKDRWRSGGAAVHPHGEAVIYPTLVRMAQTDVATHWSTDRETSGHQITYPPGGHAVHRGPPHAAGH